jgi:ornithine carbamoyltransferase
MSGWVGTTSIDWPPDLLRATDLTRVALDGLLALAGRMKAEPTGWTGALAGAALACLYEVPTTRAGLSAQVAAHRLGMEPVTMRPRDIDDEDEPPEDVGRILSGWSAAILVRDLPDPDLARLAGAATVPVINARSSEHHPCQALTDVFTVREHFGELDGLVLAYVGPAGNAARSLLTIGALAGMTVRVAAPPGDGPEPEDLAGAAILGELHGGQVALVEDPREAVAGADAIVTGPWPRPADPVERRRLHERLAPYCVTPPLVERAAARAIVLHQLPVHRGEEIRAAVVDHRRSVIWTQAANRVPVEQAIMYALSDGSEG